MRLEKIKLTGFKSFVEPTTIHLPTNLVAVVGPNGCGKSNVIDAVRWVMGEGSAKHLRGESMADVIFNGAGNRNPLAQANVELVFDNSDNSISGQYANHPEISVKRTVARDGVSTYYLNNIRCRRRDITELFMGTGLGPRSYSIIEQGMISRFIEAHPDDLRAFLEEAAGIAKYKERRKETETHITNTRENLSRLNDLREEIAKHLQHLQRQATAAEKYQTLQTEKQRLESELLALRWHTLEQKRLEQVEIITQVEANSALIQTEQQTLEMSLEEQRNKHYDINDKFKAIQINYYAIGTEIARIEQTLKLQKETLINLQKELKELTTEQATINLQIQQNQAELVTIETILSNQQLELTHLITQEQTYNSILDQTEESMRVWQEQWNEFQRTSTEPSQLAQIERLKINHLEQQMQDLEQRQNKLKQESTNFDIETLRTRLLELETLKHQQNFNTILHDCETLLNQCTQRYQLTTTELAEIAMQIEQNKHTTEQAREHLYFQLEAAEILAQQRDELTIKRNQLRTELEQAKTNVKTIHEQITQINTKLEATKINQTSIINANELLRLQLEQNIKREHKIKELLLQTEIPVDDLTIKLDAMLEQRLNLEHELNAAKIQLEMAQSSLKIAEQTRQHLEHKAKTQRELLEQARLIGQESSVQVRILEEQLKNAGYDPPTVLAALPETITPKELETQLEKCNTHLQRIGLVNLAAIDELNEEMARKTTLDTQYEDVNQALIKLEEAIHKIDQETKFRFQETFDKINSELHNLFPRLFGGGQAYLELTKNDLLNTGVTIMARPPGKRNSNIHLLSGGEKALTAVALVFAIFQLNPAPFCMLDEVDAPLDDANVGRFCELVRSMANQVQFIFITHNKVTMELANQLIGVTMNEPGVSRLVTVDINEAIKLAVN